jgi:hypothetical protein
MLKRDITCMAATFVALVCTWVGRRPKRLTFDHAVTAVSLGTPLLVLVLIDLDGLGVTRRQLIDPELTCDGPGIVLTGVSVALWAPSQMTREDASTGQSVLA